jgi:hypothetical protein
MEIAFCLRPNIFTFAVSPGRFRAMVENMEESFLTTGSWGMAKKRIALEKKEGVEQ